MKQSLSGFCQELGIPLHNVMWSWCASSSDKRAAIFTIWEDQIEDGEYIFTTKPRPDEAPNKPGRRELIRVLNESIDSGYATYGIRCQAMDIRAIPRSRKSFDDQQLLDVRIRRDGDRYIGRILGSIPPRVVQDRTNNAAWIASTAINDLDGVEIGNDDPEYSRRMSGSYVRDNNVRLQVLQRSKGVCEFCGEKGFPKVDGKPFLETHHVIALSEQGPDKTDNVIALCPNDHRRAHFGIDWKELQSEFLEILKSKKVLN